MPDETIVQNWTNQSNSQNLESGGGPSSLGGGGAASEQGALWQSFDPKYGGATATFAATGDLVGVLASFSDPFVSKGVVVDVTGTLTTPTLACAALVDAKTGGLAAVTGDFSGSLALGLNTLYWNGDTDSNAVGLKFNSGSYYVAVGFTYTALSLLSLSATNVNLGLAQPKLRSAILATGLVAATPPSSAVTLSGMTSTISVPYLQVV